MKKQHLSSLCNNTASPTTIGIIGGAGPMASSLIIKHIIEICQQQYDCFHDADFPKLILLSVPFKQMLTPNKQTQQEKSVQLQLEQALNFMTDNHVAHFAIACNTLHGFLPKNSSYPQLVHLIELTQQHLDKQQLTHTLILGTSTSATKSVHKFHNRSYPTIDQQQQLDRIITEILRGNLSSKVQAQLTAIMQASIKQNPDIDSILLGCTEFSVLMAEHDQHFMDKVIIDPLKLAAQKLCKLAFEKN